MFRSLVRINQQHQVLNRTVNFSKRRASTTSTPAAAEVINKWNTLSVEEQNNITKEIEELQKQDWQLLSVEQKKAAYYISFGDIGQREHISKPDTSKVIVGVSAVMVLSTGFFYWTKKAVTEHPKTMTKEWEEATNEKMREQNVNPISGISSEGYTGKGYVVSK